MELQTLLNGEHDSFGAILQISHGAGGTDAMDWSEMLLRMYLRWASKKGYDAKIVEILPGAEAGISKAVVTISGKYAYGYLKGERGIHRLVRISPFGAKRRETSFAAVDVIPQIDDEINIEIKEEDLKIEVFRASGHGGQHVNKTESAVRITHIPTGIVVQCQNERSQHQNKATALKLLKARLYELELQKKKEQALKNHASKARAEFGGAQIRNYILAPYRLVKDVRTGYETGNVEAVLDGDLDPFIKAYLIFLNKKEKIANGL